MSGRMVTRLALMAAACALVAGTQAQAEPVCNGTLVVASADVSTSPGTGCGNNYLATQTSNNVRQCLQESISGGLSKLSHTWRFDNVPAGTISLIYEGYRPNNSDGDNFKFSGYINPSNPYFILMPGAIINSALELQGGFQHFTNWDLPSQQSFYVNVRDSAGGTNLDTVYIDYLAVCSEPGELED